MTLLSCAAGVRLSRACTRARTSSVVPPPSSALEAKVTPTPAAAAATTTRPFSTSHRAQRHRGLVRPLPLTDLTPRPLSAAQALQKQRLLGGLLHLPVEWPAATPAQPQADQPANTSSATTSIPVHKDAVVSPPLADHRLQLLNPLLLELSQETKGSLGAAVSPNTRTRLSYVVSHILDMFQEAASQEHQSMPPLRALTSAEWLSIFSCIKQHRFNSHAMPLYQVWKAQLEREREATQTTDSSTSDASNTPPLVPSSLILVAMSILSALEPGVARAELAWMASPPNSHHFDLTAACFNEILAVDAKSATTPEDIAEMRYHYDEMPMRDDASTEIMFGVYMKANQIEEANNLVSAMTRGTRHTPTSVLLSLQVIFAALTAAPGVDQSTRYHLLGTAREFWFLVLADPTRLLTPDITSAALRIHGEADVDPERQRVILNDALQMERDPRYAERVLGMPVEVPLEADPHVSRPIYADARCFTHFIRTVCSGQALYHSKLKRRASLDHYWSLMHHRADAAIAAASRTRGAAADSKLIASRVAALTVPLDAWRHYIDFLCRTKQYEQARVVWKSAPEKFQAIIQEPILISAAVVP